MYGIYNEQLARAMADAGRSPLERYIRSHDMHKIPEKAPYGWHTPPIWIGTLQIDNTADAEAYVADRQYEWKEAFGQHGVPVLVFKQESLSYDVYWFNLKTYWDKEQEDRARLEKKVGFIPAPDMERQRAQAETYAPLYSKEAKEVGQATISPRKAQSWFKALLARILKKIYDILPS